jgi:hypothetical protein
MAYCLTLTQEVLLNLLACLLMIPSSHNGDVPKCTSYYALSVVPLVASIIGKLRKLSSREAPRSEAPLNSEIMLGYPSE